MNDSTVIKRIKISPCVFAHTPNYWINKWASNKVPVVKCRKTPVKEINQEIHSNNICNSCICQMNVLNLDNDHAKTSWMAQKTFIYHINSINKWKRNNWRSRIHNLYSNFSAIMGFSSMNLRKRSTCQRDWIKFCKNLKVQLWST